MLQLQINIFTKVIKYLMLDEDRVLRKKGNEERNSLSGKFRRARMV